MNGFNGMSIHLGHVMPKQIMLYAGYFIFGSVNVSNVGYSPGDYALGVHAKYIIMIL